MGTTVTSWLPHEMFNRNQNLTSPPETEAPYSQSVWILQVQLTTWAVLVLSMALGVGHFRLHWEQQRHNLTWVMRADSISSMRYWSLPSLSSLCVLLLDDGISRQQDHEVRNKTLKNYIPASCHTFSDPYWRRLGPQDFQTSTGQVLGHMSSRWISRTNQRPFAINMLETGSKIALYSL